MDDFIIIENHKKDKEKIIEIKEIDGNIYIKQLCGANCEKFTIKKNKLKIECGIFKLNGVKYVNINGNIIMEATKMIEIEYMTNYCNNVLIRNKYVGEIVINNCDVEMLQKMLGIIEAKTKKTFDEKIKHFIKTYLFN